MITEPPEHIAPLGQPYVRMHRTQKHGVLLIHGFAGSPYQLRRLADFLYDQGFNVSVLRIPGHASRLKYFRESKGRDWQSAVHRGAAELRASSAHIALIGLSFGGVLAMLELAEHPDMADVLIAVATPHLAKRQALLERFLPLLKVVKPSVKKPWAKPSERIGRLEMGRYESMPIEPMLEYFRLNRNLESGRLRSVRVPLLFLQGTEDTVVPKNSMDFFSWPCG